MFITMAYKGLGDFINTLEKENELIRIKEKVSTNLEITEITDRISKSGNQNKALLFENNGTDFPVLINAYGSTKRMCLALGVNNLDEPGKEIKSIFKNLTSPKNSLFEKLKLLPSLSKFGSWMPKTINGKGKCQKVINLNPDLTILPVLTCWPLDGGPFITLPSVHTKDPETGSRNVGMYRMQVFDKQTTGMHWHMHKTGAKHYRLYKEKGIRKMPVAVSLGGDPVYTYSATAPLPDSVDEYLLAGFLRKKKVELVKCISQDIEVPADAEIVIEGYVDTLEDYILEGPFGDHTGFYSLADFYPKFHVTCITHRKNAVYPTTIVGIPPQEDAWIGKATERIFLAPIQLTMLPELTRYESTFRRCGA
jgi:4-hydroxy-3-polyprenylbenzoate decarboxylase